MFLKKIISPILVLLCFVLSSGCSKQAADYVAEPVMTFTIKSTKTTNDGAPFYVILKFTDFPHFLMDDYQTIADLICNEKPDNGSFMPICLFPGKTEERIAVPPPNLSTAIYCLYTDCGEQWKLLIDGSEGCSKVTLVLGDHEIQSVDFN